MSNGNGSMISRRAVLAGLLAGTGQAAWGRAPETSLRPPARPAGGAVRTVPGAEALIAEARLSGKLGYVVANARTGQVLEQRNPLLGLPPASVLKAVTAQYALEALGPTHAFSTRIMATGPLVEGRVKGDLVLVGGADPLLNTDGLAELAAALKGAGVREVTGRFLVHDGALPRIEVIDPGQPDYLGYNPAVSGLNLNFNRVHFEWKKAGESYDVTMDARSQKYRPDIRMTRMRLADRKTPVYTYASQGGVEDWTVARSALGTGGSRWLPVRRPELYAGEVLQTFARSHGIVLKAPEPVQGTLPKLVLAERRSVPLQRILRDMLLYSTNLTAEVVGLSATAARGRLGSSLTESGAEMAAWTQDRLGLRHARFTDHSGLGDGSRISAADMVRVMTRLGPDSTLASILKTVPMRDPAGNPVTDHPATVRAKTGTLNFVSGLAGFVALPGRTDLAFAIFAADMDRRAAIPEADRDRPQGARGWSVQARKVQGGLIDRWSRLYG